MVSSFRALSFASRILGGKKDESTKEERERERNGVLLFLSIGTAEATREL